MNDSQPRDLPPQSDSDDYIVALIRRLGIEFRRPWKGHGIFFFAFVAVLAITVFSIAAAWLVSLFN